MHASQLLVRSGNTLTQRPVLTARQIATTVQMAQIALFALTPIS